MVKKQSNAEPRPDASAGLIETEECVPALSGDEAQHGLNDIFPGDPYPIRTILTQIRHCEIQALHAGLSRRDWWAVEKAANELRDKLDSLLGRISLRTPTDASAGLIEAAEYAERSARASIHEDKSKCLFWFAGLLRARASDRSGK